MPTNVITFANTEFDMRWMEPYVTEGLNQKALVLPRGIYRGFGLGTNAAVLTVTVLADPARLDHLATVETQNGFGLTLRRTTGNFSVNLAAYAGQTVVLALYGVYSAGTVTAVFVRAFTLAEYTGLTDAERRELSVLGTVTVPGPGPIPAGSITYERRTSAWMSVDIEATPWAPVVKNGSFEISDTGADYIFAIENWRKTITNAYLRATTTDPAEPAGAKSLEWGWNGGGGATGRCIQAFYIPTAPGKRVRLRYRKRALQALTAGSVQILIRWSDETGAILADTTVPVDLSTAPDAGWVEETLVTTVPASAYVLRAVAVDFVNATVALVGAALRIDDVQVWVEPFWADEVTQQIDRARYNQALEALILPDPQFVLFSDPAALVRFDAATPASEGSVVVERKDQAAAQLPPALDLKGRLLAGANLLATAAKGALARVSTTRVTTAVGQRTLIWEGMNPAGIPGLEGYPVRLYHSGVSFLFFDYDGWDLTINAEWDPATNLWHQDNPLRTSSKFGSIEAMTAISTKPAASPDWADSAWSDTPLSISHVPTVCSLLTGVVTIGGAMLGTAVNSLYARIKMNRSAFARTLLFEFPGTNAGWFRVYRSYTVGVNEDLELTCNARWNDATAQWVEDVIDNHWRLRLHTNTGFSPAPSVWAEMYGGASPWVDANWSANQDRDARFSLGIAPRKLTLMNGRLQILPSSTVSLASHPTNPPHDYVSTEANTLYAKNMVKAWGYVVVNVMGAISAQEGFNFDAAIMGVAIRVTFETPMAAGLNYAVVATMADPGPGVWQDVKMNLQNPASFDLEQFVQNGVTKTIEQQNWANAVVSFVVLAQQDT